MEKLKIDDELYSVKDSQWDQRMIYSFGKVVRLTKTQAVLSDGTKLINEPKSDWYHDGKVVFSEYGNKYNRWFFVTEEIILVAKKEKERQFIRIWFNKREFSDEEKKIVYLKFKELDLLKATDTNSK